MKRPGVKAHFISLYKEEWLKCNTGAPKEMKAWQGALYAQMASHYHVLFGYEDLLLADPIKCDEETGYWTPGSLPTTEGLDAIKQEELWKKWCLLHKYTAGVKYSAGL